MKLSFSKLDLENQNLNMVRKLQNMSSWGNRMVFSSENVPSFMQCTRPTVQNFSTRKSRYLKMKQGIPPWKFNDKVRKLLENTIGLQNSSFKLEDFKKLIQKGFERIEQQKCVKHVVEIVEKYLRDDGIVEDIPHSS